MKTSMMPARPCLPRPSRRACSGFTLAELTVMLVIFSLFSTTALATMIIAMRFWTQSNQRVTAEQNVRIGLAAIIAEARQAIPNPDPGATNQATGYVNLSPAVAPTGFVTPNANSTTASVLLFTEINTSNYAPNSGTFSVTSPANYRQVSYYVSNNALYRQATTFNSSGQGTAGTADIIVAASPTGSMSLATAYQLNSSLGTNNQSQFTQVEVTLTATEGSSSMTMSGYATPMGINQGSQ